MNSQQTPTILHRATFECMTLDQQQEHFSEQGFVLLPQIVSSDHIARVRSEVEGVDRYDFIERRPGPHMEQLITNPTLLQPLRRCYGEHLKFFKSVYAEWRDVNADKKKRGRQGLHRDYRPDPLDGDYRNSCASWCNVGHYFIDLEINEGPLWVVPGSHKLAWTNTHGPLEQFANDACIVLAKAGDAVMLHNLTIHAGGVMSSGRPRPSLFQSYRPSWAAPLKTVPEWPEAVVKKASPDLRRLLVGQNDGVRVSAHGIISR